MADERSLLYEILLLVWQEEYIIDLGRFFTILFS